jgi:hypothetical protein
MFDRKTGYGSFMISGLDWTEEKLHEVEHHYPAEPLVSYGLFNAVALAF